MNTTAIAQTQALLLKLLSTQHRVSPEALATLNEADWVQLLATCRQHRLAPLLHWQLTRHHHLAPPPAVRDVLADAFRQASLRSLMLQSALSQIHQALQAVGIPHVALKGVGLAWSAYPHPALRPMRDLDILIPQAQLIQAYNTLLQHGCKRIEGHAGSPEAAMALGKKHLPPLHMAKGKLVLELHARLSDAQHHPDRADIAADGDFWARCATLHVGGADICIESPTDLLWHLIDHSVYEHQFDNGPLLLSDVAYLLGRHQIDWQLLWAQAAQAQKTRGCVLALRLVERHWGRQDIVWPEGLAGPDMREPDMAQQFEDCDALMLIDLKQVYDERLQAGWLEATQAQGRWHWLLSKLLPPRAVMATKFEVAANSPWVLACYPRRWGQQLSERLPGLLPGRKPRVSRSQAVRLMGLRRWLSH